jgi:hypothetical protein
MSTGTDSGHTWHLTRPPSSRRLIVLAVVATLAAAAVILLATTSNNAGNTPSRNAAPDSVDNGLLKIGVPRILSTAQLRAFAATASGPIYWAGPAGPATRLEVTVVRHGDVFIRYLTGTAAVGDPHPSFTTIGTYGVANAYRVVNNDGNAKAATRLRIPDGGIAINTARAPHSFYIAFPGQNYAAEIYATTTTHARRLALSGRIAPVP